MKKIFLNSLIILILSFALSGCFKRDTMEGITVYTTIYPIEYITSILYGTYAEIYSIYPSNIDVEGYRLTDKQYSDYSKGGLFIYNGLSNEKDYAITMLNKNKKLKIIDAAMNMEYISSIEEIWLDPSNFLMMTQNIKKGFEEYITNPYLKNEISKNYELLKIDISEVDAELKLIAQNAENKTIVVSNDMFLFLEKYEFNVISLQEDKITPKKIADVIDLINDKTIEYIFIKPNEKLNDTINDLINNYGLKTLTFKIGDNLTEEERYEKTTFIDILNYNIDLLKQKLYQ